jgi:hypothetical protein
VNDTNYEDPFHEIYTKLVIISSTNKERFKIKRGIKGNKQNREAFKMSGG